MQLRDDVWLPDSPLLQYLVNCKYVEKRDFGRSDDDIYPKAVVEEGVRKLQVMPQIPDKCSSVPPVKRCKTDSSLLDLLVGSSTFYSCFYFPSSE